MGAVSSGCVYSLTNRTDCHAIDTIFLISSVEAEQPELDESEELDQHQHHQLIYPTTYHVSIPAESIPDEALTYQLTPRELSTDELSTELPNQLSASQLLHGELPPNEVPATSMTSSTPVLRIRDHQGQGK